MKREELMRHIRTHDCEILRDSGKHTVVHNPAKKRQSSVPRHNEIKKFLARGICKQLDIPLP